MSFSGKRHSADSRKKISETLKGKAFWIGKHLPEETRRKISETKMGKKMSAEARQKMSERQKGRRHSEETKRKISEAQKGEKGNMWSKHHLEITKRKMSKAGKGKHLSESHRRKIGEARSGKYGGEKSYNWQGGKSFEPYGLEFNRRLKRQILERDGHECQLCGAIEDLCIHHLDRNKRDNELTNLITLCRLCHSRITSFSRKLFIRKDR